MFFLKKNNDFGWKEAFPFCPISTVALAVIWKENQSIIKEKEHAIQF